MVAKNLDWIEACVDISKLQNLMANAKKLGEESVYWRAFKRRCELEGLNHSDPLHREFHAMLAAYEELLTQKNARTTRANRTRQKLKNKGVVQSLEDWARSSTSTMGFELLVANGQARLTGEYLVVRYADRFSEEAVSAAKRRLAKVGVELSHDTP